MLHDVSRELVEIGSVAKNSLPRSKGQGGRRTDEGDQLTLLEKGGVVGEIKGMKA
jgi:hypothetical protein